MYKCKILSGNDNRGRFTVYQGDEPGSTKFDYERDYSIEPGTLITDIETMSSPHL